jgi:hypothetical protein
MTLLERKAGLEPASFRAHWRGAHAQIVASLPGLGAYTQNHVVREACLQGCETEIAGLVEVWFEASGVGLHSHFSPAQLADEPSFLEGLVGFQLGEIPYASAAAAVWVLGGDADWSRAAQAASDVSATAEFSTAAIVDSSAGVMVRDHLPHRLAAPDRLLGLGFKGLAEASAAFDRLVSALAGTSVRVLLAEQIVVVPPPGR